MPRVWFYPWRSINSLEKLEKWRFSDPDDPHLAVRQLQHLRMGKVKTRRKLGYLSENLTWIILILPGEFQIGKSQHGKIPLTPTKITQYKPIYSCTAVHRNFSNFSTFPNFCLGTDPLPVGIHDADWSKGSPIKFPGEILPREHELWISKVPHYKPMGKSVMETDMLTLQCQRQLWKFIIRAKIFRFSEVGLKMHFRQFPALRLFSQWRPRSTPGSWICMTLQKAIKGGQFEASGSVEIRQPKSEDVCIEFYGRAISASSVSYYYSYCIRARPSDSRQQASRPSSATGLGPGQHRHSTIHNCRRLPTPTPSTAVADTVPTLAANQFITTPTVWVWVGL